MSDDDQDPGPYPQLLDADPRAGKPRVLVPGAHWTPEGYVERGSDVFVDDVLDRLPADTLCRLGKLVGRIAGPEGKAAFETLTVEAMRLLTDRHVALERSKQDDHGGFERQFCPATKDHGALLLSAATSHPSARDLVQVVRHPVYLADWTLAQPGWNKGGVYYDEPADLRGLAPNPDPQVLLDALSDFPFKDEASRFNALGFMLTPLIRPAVGNVPMHLVHAAQERTGKTKLVELMAALCANMPVIPTLRLDASDEEQDKRILSLLRDSPSVVHLDNVNHDIDSAALASLITASVYSGRILGQSSILACPNRTALIASGNNVSLSSEMAKRTVPILLQADRADPESRDRFNHPDLAAHARTAKRPVLCALIGLVELWKSRGSPEGPHRLGGFEAWAAAVGGCLEGSAWFDNVRDWHRKADPKSADLDAFVKLWSEQPDAARLWKASELAKLANQAGLFPACFAKGDHAGAVSFSNRVLCKSVDRFVGLHAIRRVGSGSSSYWRIESILVSQT